VLVAVIVVHKEAVVVVAAHIRIHQAVANIHQINNEKRRNCESQKKKLFLYSSFLI
jgi:hypothetical protein